MRRKYMNIHRQIDDFHASLISNLKQPDSFLDRYMLSVNSRLFASLGLVMAFLSSTGYVAVGQTAATPMQLSQASSTTLAVNVVYVNPNTGNDSANGNERTPLKTITQALQVAQPNTVILLAPGTYSAASGETFPLTLKPRVSIQGNTSNKGRDIIIQGGGLFMSPTFARQNVAIVGANEAGLTGVTVTNPNPRGYGLWVESSSPVVANNTFLSSTHDGISVNGNGAPTIRNNYFYQNGANGITIYGSSRPEVRENLFEKTGFGVNIAQNAAPTIVDNQIINNRTGVVVQGNARPVLRGNTIEGNTEDGIVAIAQATPNLGTASEPGNNMFRNNARYEINASKAKQAIPAFGNAMATSRTSGNIDFNGTVAVAPLPETTAAAATAPSAVPGNVSPATSFPTPSGVTQTNVANITPIPVRNTVAPPAPQAARTRELPEVEQSYNYVRINPETATQLEDGGKVIEFAAPEEATPAEDAITTAPQPQRNLPVVETTQPRNTALLPVPESNIPVGSLRNLPLVPTQERGTVSQPRPQVATGSRTGGRMRFRVMVPAATDREQAAVRAVVPGAFRTVVDKQVMMQVGVFSDRINADKIIRVLNRQGIQAIVQQI